MKGIASFPRIKKTPHMGNIEEAPVSPCTQVFFEDAPRISNRHLPTSKLNHLAAMVLCHVYKAVLFKSFGIS